MIVAVLLVALVVAAAGRAGVVDPPVQIARPVVPVLVEIAVLMRKKKHGSSWEN